MKDDKEIIDALKNSKEFTDKFGTEFKLSDRKMEGNRLYKRDEYGCWHFERELF